MAVVKVCGVVSDHEVDLLRDCAVDLIGIWCGVVGGLRDLPQDRAAALVDRARRGRGPRPMLVTTLTDECWLRRIVARTDARWVQLHGWQSPALVRRLKAESGLTVVKALHVRDGHCLEERLIPAYERAGTDWFLLDTLASDGRVGSTGTAIGAVGVLSVVGRCTRPFLLAGGISVANRAEYAAVVGHPLYRGVDVDTAARDSQGRLDARRIGDLVHAWRPGLAGGGVPPFVTGR